MVTLPLCPGIVCEVCNIDVGNIATKSIYTLVQGFHLRLNTAIKAV